MVFDPNTSCALVKSSVDALSRLATRGTIEESLQTAGKILLRQGQPERAADILHFVLQMPPAITDSENPCHEAF